MEIFKQKIKRNFLFWGYHAQIMVGMMGGMGIVYTIFFNMGSHTTVSYFQIMGIMSAYIVPISYISYFSLTVSFGGNRREGLWGMQWMNLQVFLELLIMNIIADRILHDGKETGNSLLMLWAMIACFAAGQLTAAMILRFGNKARFICVAVFGVVVVSGAILFQIPFGAALVSNRSLLITLGAAGAILLYIGSELVLRHVVKRYEVFQA